MPFDLDYGSFIAGVQVGRRLKAWDAARDFRIPIYDRNLATEDLLDITTEDDVDIMPDFPS